jgi:hypothetical protein
VIGRRTLATAFVAGAMSTVAAIAATNPAPHVVTGALYSEPVVPRDLDVDLRALPAPAPWQPGDPIREVPRRHRFKPSVEKAPVPRRDALLDVQSRVANSEVAERAFGTALINRAGQGYTGTIPPDPIGDVGLTYFIQAVNQAAGTQYTVYNKTTGAVVAGPFVLSALGGQGGCASGAGDPIVLYDHLANRWLLSEFADAANTLCVYISKTSDPVSGGWYNYQFTTPDFPDYPKYGLWTNAYYVTSNESSPAYYAIERTRMLSGLSAGMQRFTAPALAGFDFQSLTPCDLDGSTPPAGAPHYALRHRDDEVHNPGSNNPSQDYLDLFELRINWTTPASSTLTGPVAIPVAEFDSHLNGYTSFEAIPQPGTTVKLDPVREVVMWRLQYRNFGDHEALVGCFVTDVDGTDHAGLRWFELRRTTGAWSAYQQGTYAPDAASRWMGSIAMDASGNIALGYNVSSSTVYPGLRYAGRLNGDPLGTLTRGEYTLASGSAANASNRYGDYSAMTVDPVDGCTFWFTGEYNPAAAWSTRIGAFTFDSCGCTPPAAPATLAATADGPNRIRLSWAPVAAADSYAIYRTLGDCPQDSFLPLTSGLTNTVFVDTEASGGIPYAYVVRAFDAQAGCESANSPCASVVTTGPCSELPVFAGLAAATNTASDPCAIRLTWAPADPQCGSNVVYHVYRATDPAFVPSFSNLLAACIDGLTYDDRTAAPGTTYAYAVRAEAPSGVGEGPCVGGSSDTNTVRKTAAAYGAATALFSDTLEGGSGSWTFEKLDSDSSSYNWSLVTTSSSSPTHSAFCREQAFVIDRTLRMSAGLALPGGAPLVLEFRHRFNTEPGFDGGVLEYSTNNGATWHDILAGNGGTVPANASRFLSGGYIDTISTGYGSTIAGRQAWSGANGAFQLTRVDLSQMAATTLKLRWRLACDSSDIAEGEGPGWWVDDVRIVRAQSCTQGGYTSWRNTIAWTGSGAPQADDNADGSINFEAYFFGIPATGSVPAPALSRLPAVRPVGTQLVYGFAVNTSAVMAASFSIQTRTNLLDGRWQPILPTPTPDGAGRVTLPVDPPDAERMFYRLNMQE